MPKLITSSIALLLCTLLMTSSATAQMHMNAAIGLAKPESSDLSTGGALRLGVGYQLFDLVAFELGYSDLGKFDGDEGSSLDLSTVEFVGIANYPIGDIHELFIKAGTHRWKVDLTGEAEDYSDNDEGSDPVFGIGYAYVLHYQGALKAEINQYDVGDDEVSTFWVSFEARF